MARQLAIVTVALASFPHIPNESIAFARTSQTCPFCVIEYGNRLPLEFQHPAPMYQSLGYSAGRVTIGIRQIDHGH